MSWLKYFGFVKLPSESIVSLGHSFVQILIHTMDKKLLFSLFNTLMLQKKVAAFVFGIFQHFPKVRHVAVVNGFWLIGCWVHLAPFSLCHFLYVFLFRQVYFVSLRDVSKFGINQLTINQNSFYKIFIPSAIPDDMMHGTDSVRAKKSRRNLLHL